MTVCGTGRHVAGKHVREGGTYRGVQEGIYTRVGIPGRAYIPGWEDNLRLRVLNGESLRLRARTEITSVLELGRG